MALDSKYSRMVLCMKGTSVMGIQMDLEEAYHLKERSIKATLTMIRWKEEASFSGKMEGCMMESGRQARKLAKGSSTGLMVKYTKENLKITSVVELANCIILMARRSKECGRMERNMASALTCGLTEPDTMSFILMAKSKGKDSLRIQLSV
jgi:hypothetical protein